MDRWSISVPGVPSMVPVARLFARAFLAGHPLVDDPVVSGAELIVSEYATNAIRHTAAGQGGTIQVAIAVRPGLVRIEVSDHAPIEALQAGAAGPVPAAGPAGEEDEGGRGLLLVDAIACRWGHDGVAGRGTAWAEVAGLEVIAEAG